jgi:phenylalanyl-tRNA synthetase beta chain
VERRFYPDIDPVRLQNPMSEDASVLRTSLAPGLLAAVQWNLNRGTRNLQLYELGKVYRPGGERRSLVLAACGAVRLAGVHETAREFDFFALKGDIEEIVLHGFNTPVTLTTDNRPKYYHPGRFARIGHLALFGELHPAYAEPFKFRQRIYIAEIDIDMLLSSAMDRPIREIPKFPAIRRDFSLLLDRGTSYASVRETILRMGIPEVADVNPFDRMESGAFPESKYGLSISVRYQSNERTLTDVEVEAFDRDILKTLEERLGAQVRK